MLTQNPDKIGPDKIAEIVGGKIGPKKFFPQRIYEVCTILS